MTVNSTRSLLNSFLAEKEQRALRMAEFAVGSRDDAFDIVQDAMIRFATRYTKKPQNEWAPLFYRVLQSRIQDYFRKSSVKNKYFAWLPRFDDDDDSVDPIQQAGDYEAISQERIIDSEAHAQQISHAVSQLPERQQQAFLLRCWEGLSTKETAQAMECSEGSVKTHYSRALQQLKKTLKGAYEQLSDHVVSEA